MRLAWIGFVAPLFLVACTENAVTYCENCYPVYDSGFGPGDGASGEPMLVRAETGKTLTSSPGSGVGVFVQYAAGGHWTVWWTCDTNKSLRTCDYVVDAKALNGAITNIAGYDGTTLTPTTEGGLVEAGAPAFPIQGSVTKDIQGVTFDTEPGAILEVSASLNGSFDGSLFYFVQGDKVKDGYQGSLTDPLEFEPTSP